MPFFRYLMGEGKMDIVQRVKDILVSPKQTWLAIEGEATDAASLYKNYIMLLAAIPAVAGFIGMSVIGLNAFGVSMRTPIVTGLVQMVVGYALSLIMMFVVALIVDTLAPTFGGQKSQISALKLVAYASTAGLLGGIFSLLPALSALALLASLYSIYLVYLGLPVLMKCPQEKALPYTAVLIVCAVIAGALLGAVSAMFAPAQPMHLGSTEASKATVTIETPEGKVTIDSRKAEEFARRMEETGKRIEEARKSGDQEAMAKAMKEMAANIGIQPPAKE
jgi:hypothetical protein